MNILTITTSNYYEFVYYATVPQTMWVFFWLFHPDHILFLLALLYYAYFCILGVIAKLSYKSSNMFPLKLFLKFTVFNDFFKIACVYWFVCICASINNFILIIPHIKWPPFYSHSPFNTSFKKKNLSLCLSKFEIYKALNSFNYILEPKQMYF